MSDIFSADQSPEIVELKLLYRHYLATILHFSIPFAHYYLYDWLATRFDVLVHGIALIGMGWQKKNYVYVHTDLWFWFVYLNLPELLKQTKEQKKP